MTKPIALITGANKGIGFETARQLAREGVHVIVASRDESKGNAAAKRISDEGLSAEAVAVDVTDLASIEAAARDIEKKHGRLDILVNTAGIMIDAFDKAPSEQGLDLWRRTFDTNLFGVVATTKAVLPLIHKSAKGRIVNVSSILGSMAANVDPKDRKSVV
jgi:NAD(P)-dependent dehydrogenase (short-subunit alcohol dehydrogenase family)